MQMWRIILCAIFVMVTILAAILVIILYICHCILRKKSGTQNGLAKNELYYAYREPDKMNVFLKIYNSSIFVLVFYVVLVYFDYHQFDYFENIIGHVEGLETIVLAFTAMVITVIIFSNSLSPKQYYLTITKEEILKRHHIPTCYYWIASLTFASIISYWGLKHETDSLIMSLFLAAFQIAIIFVILIDFYVLISIGKISFGNQKFEMKSLHYLYRIFWNNNSIKCTTKSKDTINVNLAYLLKKYINLKVIKCGNNGRYKITFQEGEKLKKEQYKDYVSMCCRMGIVLAISSIIIGVFCYEIKVFCIVAIVLYAIIIITIIMPKARQIKKEFFVTYVLGKDGFLIDNDKKECYISLFPWCFSMLHSKEKKYIQYVKNIMALYCIITQCFEESMYTEIKESIIAMIDFLRESKEEKITVNDSIYYLPVFVSSYYFYINCCKERHSIDFPKEVSKLFEELKLEPEDRADYKEMLSSFIYDAELFRGNKWISKTSLQENIQDYYKNYIDETGYWKILTGEGEIEKEKHNKKNKKQKTQVG